VATAQVQDPLVAFSYAMRLHYQVGHVFNVSVETVPANAS
jgi:hypothetical protein